MSVASGWVCRVCWKLNRLQDERCYKCRSPRGVDEAAAEEQRKVLAAKAEEPEAVPDLVVALPVSVFRAYGKVWMRGGFSLFGVLFLIAFGGVTDLAYLGLTGGFAVALVLCGAAAGEVAEGMRNREVWAFLVAIVLSVVGVIGSILAFQVFAPDLVSPTAVRWGSLIVFGGAGIAAIGGLVMMARHGRPSSG